MRSLLRIFYPCKNPPSTQSVCPVIKEASSDARKYTAAATSCGLPIRQSGVSSASASRVSLECMAFISVSMTPGATQLTRIPEGPSSLASAFVKPIRPDFVAEYGTSQEAPATPQIEDILTIAPCFRESIAGAAHLQYGTCRSD